MSTKHLCTYLKKRNANRSEETKENVARNKARRRFDKSFKHDGVEVLLQMASRLRGAVGHFMPKEIQELETAALMLKHAKSLEQWDTKVQSTVNPLLRKIDNQLQYRFGMGLGDI